MGSVFSSDEDRPFTKFNGQCEYMAHKDGWINQSKRVKIAAESLETLYKDVSRLNLVLRYLRTPMDRGLILHCRLYTSVDESSKISKLMWKFSDNTIIRIDILDATEIRDLTKAEIQRRLLSTVGKDTPIGPPIEADNNERLESSSIDEPLATDNPTKTGDEIGSENKLRSWFASLNPSSASHIDTVVRKKSDNILPTMATDVSNDKSVLESVSMQQQSKQSKSKQSQSEERRALQSNTDMTSYMAAERKEQFQKQSKPDSNSTQNDDSDAKSDMISPPELPTLLHRQRSLPDPVSSYVLSINEFYYLWLFFEDKMPEITQWISKQSLPTKADKSTSELQLFQDFVHRRQSTVRQSNASPPDNDEKNDESAFDYSVFTANDGRKMGSFVDETPCVICFEQPQNVIVLECLHEYCKECLDEWKKEAGGDACPLCRCLWEQNETWVKLGQTRSDGFDNIDGYFKDLVLFPFRYIEKFPKWDNYFNVK